MARCPGPPGPILPASGSPPLVLRLCDGRTERMDVLPGPPPPGAWDWVELDLADPDAPAWLAGRGLPEQVVEGLTDERTRPRLARAPEGLLVILCAVADGRGRMPGELGALRLWASGEGIVALRAAPLPALTRMAERLASGHGPAGPGTALVDLVERLTDEVEPVAAGSLEEIDALEEAVLAGQEPADVGPRLSALRRSLVRLRRDLDPQRDALARLARVRTDLLDEAARLDLAESAAHAQRHAEEVDGARERAVILQEELAARADEHLARRSFQISLAAAAFLPATLLTGLLGVNVAGIPGAEAPGAFWRVAVLCLVLAIAPLAVLLARRGL